MTFEEKLDRAKTGSKAAYESLCLGSLDKLYTAALISLKNEGAARSVCNSAIKDGYTGITRIRDERHLRSWLVHELTKNAVDMLKEFKASGVSHIASGIFADTGRLPDVERLVFSVAAVFGYGTREISVLTGMSEETVSDKLISAKEHLGSSYTAICTAAKEWTAPESLRSKYSGFDESVARLEQNAYSEMPVPAPAPVPAPVSEVPSEPQDQPEPEPKPYTPAPQEETNEADDTVFTDGEEEETDDEAPDSAEYNDGFEEPQGSSEEEPSDGSEEAAFADEQEPPSAGTGDMPLNAETFIAVVSAERMKGSEFLRLIGNTRISNSAYREIEQNPRLTKKRLIALLEESPLTENDYYKLLTAIKDRRDVLNAKEESRLAHERAGLYDGSRREKYRRKHREKKKTELELAIGLGEKENPVQSLTSEINHVYKDNSDFELQNAERSFSRSRLEYERTEDSREAAVPASKRTEIRSAQFSGSSMHALFDEGDDEPVDPFAAIAANGTGVPVKPDRTDKQESDRYGSGKSGGEHKGIAEHQPGNSSGTIEFDTRNYTAVTDTRPFDAVIPGVQFTEIPASEETAPVTSPAESEDSSRITADNADISGQADIGGSEPETSEKPPRPESSMTQILDSIAADTVLTSEETESDIVTEPVQDGIPVTQIIQDYAQPAPEKPSGRPESSMTQILDSIAADTGLAPEEADSDITTSPAQEDVSMTQIIREYSDSAPVEAPEDKPVHRKFSVTRILDTIAADTGLTPEEAENDIITEPVKNDMSMTQIIRGYDEDPDFVPETAPEPEEPEPAPEAAEEHEHAIAPEEEDIPEPAPISVQDTGPEEPIGFRPAVDLVFDEASDGMDDDDIENTSELAFSFGDSASGDEKEPEPEPASDKEPVRSAPEPEYEDEEPDGADTGDFDEAPARRRYKGNEYFVDDDEYYEGVNRGKIIACAFFAVLLIAGSVGMKFLSPAETADAPVINDTAITHDITGDENGGQDTAADEETTAAGEVTLTRLTSYAGLTDEKYKGSRMEPIGGTADGHLRASAEPYDTSIVKGTVNAVFSEDTVYYLRDAGSRICIAGFGESPEDAAEEDTDTDSDESVNEEIPVSVPTDLSAVYAMTLADGDLQIIGLRGNETVVTVYGKDLSKKNEYRLGGVYAGSFADSSGLTVAVAFDTSSAASAGYSSEHPYYTENGELHEIPAEDIYAIDGAAHNAVFVLFSPASGNYAAVLGGCAGTISSGEHLKPHSGGSTLVISEDGNTYAVDLTSDLKINGAVSYKGTAFSADCIGEGGMIGAYRDEDGSCGMTAYKGGQLIRVPDEIPKSVAWSESGTAYVVTEQNGTGQRMLYGFDMTGETPVSASIAASDIYTDKLIRAGTHLAGLKAEPGADGERAGLRLSLYDYDGSLNESAHTIIELDKDTPRENLKYLSSPVEQDISLLAMNEDGTLFAVPTVYFDGFSEVERVVLLRFDGSSFTQVNEHIAYDRKSSFFCAAIRGSQLYVITDSKVTKVPIGNL